VPVVLTPGRVLVVVDETAGGEVTTAVVGIVPTGLGKGVAVGVGTAAAELTPRLPISVDPKGIPVRALPPGVVGDVDVGVDDAATLLEPEPHLPDKPGVFTVAEVVGVPDVAVLSPLAAVADPIAVPPPS
jgi:hypothetical protein